MRESVKELVGIVAEALPVGEPIVEFGALQVPGQEGFADLRPLFPGKQYIGADMREGPGVDKLLDLHHIDLPSESVGAVLVIDTLEHVEFPHRALEEVHRILRPGGLAVITSVMDFPIHDHPHDYWRFTPDGFRSLLRIFPSSLVEQTGDESLPHTVIGLGFKGGSPPLAALLPRIEQWKRKHAVAGRWDAGRTRKRQQQRAGAAVLAGLLVLCAYFARALPLAGFGLSAGLGVGLSYLLGYYLTSKSGRISVRQTRRLTWLALPVIALVLLLPSLAPHGRHLWRLLMAIAASAGAYLVGRGVGRRRHRDT